MSITLNGVPLVIDGQVNRQIIGTISRQGGGQTFFQLHGKEFAVASAAGTCAPIRPNAETVAAIRAGLRSG